MSCFVEKCAKLMMTPVEVKNGDQRSTHASNLRFNRCKLIRCNHWNHNGIIRITLALYYIFQC